MSMHGSRDKLLELCNIADELAEKPPVDQYDAKLKSQILKYSTIFRLVSKYPEGPASRSLADAISNVETLSSTEYGRLMLPYPDAQRAFTNLKYAATRLLRPN